MQLIIGGMGFIAFTQGEIGTRAFVERLDVNDRSALLEIGARHPITGIIHLVTPALLRSDPHEALEDSRMGMNALMNVFEVAQEWKVRRVALASTIGVYAGVDSNGAPLREDLLLPIFAPHPIPTLIYLVAFG